MRTASNDVVVPALTVKYLAPDHPAPSNVPFELTNYVQPGNWRSRLTTAQRVSARYSKTLLERFWVVLMVIAAVAIPWGLSGIVWDLMMKDDIVTRTKVIEARLIGFALFVSVLVVFFIPILTWKLIGRWQLNKLADGWTRSDRALQGASAGSATWKISTPRILKTGLTLTVSLPTARPPSTFHRDAYLPSYINRSSSSDDDDAYFYPYKGKEGSGLPRMSVVGNVPMLFNEKNYDRV
jgi:hypothetical protein